ncbi:MAG: hypothetical protein PHC92_08245 [Syntrophomonadaceae bacterium]|nr:hypothetical protein [Syntrophomonadaceae bacterium]MDD3023560.1 hypothetical protein [Syntrophomonadaceae bacterium]
MASNCENCKWRASAEKNPKAFMSRLWHWHSKWCPGWKAYKKEKQMTIKK